MQTRFKSKSRDSHLRAEENQWAEILSKGNPYVGLILIYDQKLCAYAHELGSAISEGKITIGQVEFYGSRIQMRIGKLLELLEGFDENLKSITDFQKLRDDTAKLRNNHSSYNLFLKLPEQIHAMSHKLCDELYSMVSKLAN